VIAEEVNEIIASYRAEKGSLIGILQDIQSHYNYLPKEALVQVSKRLQIPPSRVYSVANFYTAFSLKPRGKHLIKVCMGTACHVRGGERILDRLMEILGISSGQTTKDLKFTLETVNCLGACALGPLMVIDNQYHAHVSMAKIPKILKMYEEKEEVPA